VVVNDNLNGSLPNADCSHPVVVDSLPENGMRLVTSDVVSEKNRYHHDSKKLAQTLMRIYYDRNQPPPAATQAENKLVGALQE